MAASGSTATGVPVGVTEPVRARLSLIEPPSGTFAALGVMVIPVAAILMVGMVVPVSVVYRMQLAAGFIPIIWSWKR